MPETFFTVWHNVFERGALKSGESILVHGGSSGIGTVAIHACQGVWRARVRYRRIGGKMRGLPQARRRLAINYKTEDFVAAVKAATGDNGVNVILDMVGGDYIDRNYDAPPSKGASCRSRSLIARKRMSISAGCWASD